MSQRLHFTAALPVTTLLFDAFRRSIYQQRLLGYDSILAEINGICLCFVKHSLTESSTGCDWCTESVARHSTLVHYLLQETSSVVIMHHQGLAGSRVVWLQGCATLHSSSSQKTSFFLDRHADLHPQSCRKVHCFHIPLFISEPPSARTKPLHLYPALQVA